MNRKWFGLLCLTIVLSLASVGSITAHSEVQPHGLSLKNAQGNSAETVVFDLSDLGFATANELRGPYQAVFGNFSLPYDWALTGDVLLELRLTSAFQSLLEAFTTEEFADNVLDRYGIVRVELNGKQIGEERITDSGSYALQFELSAEDVLLEMQTNTLRISWDASAACQQSITTAISIDGDASLSFPMETRAVKPAMRYFPAPFYAPDAIASYPTALVVPASADADTLSAMAAVAAGLGRQSAGQIDLTVYRGDTVPASVLDSHHLVLVGTDADIAQVIETNGGAQAPNPGTSSPDGAGAISLLPSVWNGQRAMLVVSGADGTALRKAAAAVSAESFFTTTGGNQAYITDVADPLEGRQWDIDQTFTAMFDWAEITADALGMEAVRLAFHVPADISLSPEAYIELYFRHSQLINYLQSSVTVGLNGRTIGTIRFGDQTATNGLARIILPPNSVRPLRNELTLTFTLVPQDLCADERSGNYWVTIFGDSYLHLPPVFEDTPLAERVYLDDVRSTFFSKSSFSDLSLVLGDIENGTLQAAADLAVQLGAMTIANQMLMDAQVIDTLDAEAGEKAVMLIADSTQVAGVDALNMLLPLPFRSDGTLARLDSEGVSFSLDTEQDFGVLQVVERGNGKRPWVLVSGNSSKGIQLAVDSMLANLQSPSGERTTVEMTDSAGDAHAFLIETDVQLDQDDAPADTIWQRIFSVGGSNQLALVLMVPAMLITIGYGVWLLRQRRKRS